MDGMTVETVELTPDAKGNVSVAVPDGMTTPQTPSTELSFKAGDLQSDLAKLAAETGIVKPDTQTQPVAEQVRAVEPEQPATAPATPVPDKFKNADGTVNEEKVEKSLKSAEERIANLDKFLAKEKEMRQKESEARSISKPQAQQTQPAQQIQANTPLTPFEHAMAQDLINRAAAQGLQLDHRLAIAQAQVMAQGFEAKHAAELSVTQQIRERLEIQDRTTEIERIAKDDEWVLSDEGFKALVSIRERYPHVNASNTPWAAAYDQHLANQAKAQRLSGQVLNPTPQAKTAKAPPTPVNAVQRAVVKPSEPDMSNWSADQISRHAASLGPKAEAEFFKKYGLRL